MIHYNKPEYIPRLCCYLYTATRMDNVVAEYAVSDRWYMVHKIRQIAKAALISHARGFRQLRKLEKK